MKFHGNILKTMVANRGRRFEATAIFQHNLLSFDKDSAKISSTKRTKATIFAIFGETKVINFAQLYLKLNVGSRTLLAFAFQIQ